MKTVTTKIRYGYLQYLTLEAVQELNDKVSALDDLTELASSSALSIDGDSSTFWSRLTELASAFVDGVLKLASAEITYMKAESIETNTLSVQEEICFDGVCITSEEFRAVFGDENEDAGDEIEVKEDENDKEEGDDSENKKDDEEETGDEEAEDTDLSADDETLENEEDNEKNNEQAEKDQEIEDDPEEETKARRKY